MLFERELTDVGNCTAGELVEVDGLVVQVYLHVTNESHVLEKFRHHFRTRWHDYLNDQVLKHGLLLLDSLCQQSNIDFVIETQHQPFDFLWFFLIFDKNLVIFLNFVEKYIQRQNFYFLQLLDIDFKRGSHFHGVLKLQVIYRNVRGEADSQTPWLGQQCTRLRQGVPIFFAQSSDLIKKSLHVKVAVYHASDSDSQL